MAIRTLAKSLVWTYLGLTVLCLGGAVITATPEPDWAVFGIAVPSGRWWALSFGIGSVAAGLLVLQLIGGYNSYGVLRPLIGADRRFSTSLTQVAIWTVIIVTMLGYLLGRVIFEGAPIAIVLPPSDWDQYLILLGGPFAAAVLAKGIVTYKLQEGTLQKSEAPETTPRQIFTSDDGSADLVDSQYFLFNVVAMIYVIIALFAENKLPVIPTVVLALTSATAATFVANKAAQRNAPSITSVSPITAKSGDVVTIFGTNFDPADANDDRRRITVSLSGVTERIYPGANSSSDTMVRFIVPATAVSGDQTVRVTSSAGVDSPPAAIEIRSKLAVVTGLDTPGTLWPGARATIMGRNLGSTNDRIPVKVGTMLTEGTTRDDGTRLEFIARLPDPTAATVDVTVTPIGQQAVTQSFVVERPQISSAWRKDGSSLQFRASGISREQPDHDPAVLINSRTAQGLHEQHDLYSVQVPRGVQFDGEIQLVVVDSIGRSSSMFRVGAVV